VYLRIELTNSYRMAVKTQLYLCNIRDLVHPDFNDNIALFYSSSDLYVQPEDGLTERGRNM